MKKLNIFEVDQLTNIERGLPKKGGLDNLQT